MTGIVFISVVVVTAALVWAHSLVRRAVLDKVLKEWRGKMGIMEHKVKMLDMVSDASMGRINDLDDEVAVIKTKIVLLQRTIESMHVKNGKKGRVGREK